MSNGNYKKKNALTLPFAREIFLLLTLLFQAPVVQRVDKIIHWITKSSFFIAVIRLDRDLSGGLRSQPFEQLGSPVQNYQSVLFKTLKSCIRFHILNTLTNEGASLQTDPASLVCRCACAPVKD